MCLCTSVLVCFVGIICVQNAADFEAIVYIGTVLEAQAGCKLNRALDFG